MFFWDPDPIAFTIPFINFPIYVYGLCFVTGFIFGYYLLIYLFKTSMPHLAKNTIQGLVDQLTWAVVIGTIIGARLGHVIFYDWERYRNHPWQILNTREGGLASHGGAIGVLLALAAYYFFIFRKKAEKKFLELIDWVVIPTALVAFFIRLGNFFNQEIVGIPTTAPWAVIFGSPAEQIAALPRHPAQLYEAFSYLAIFGVLLFLWKTTDLIKKTGFFTGFFFVSVFGSRFLIEFVKAEQASIFNQSLLQAGQLLSIPFVLAGLALLWKSKHITA